MAVGDEDLQGLEGLIDRGLGFWIGDLIDPLVPALRRADIPAWKTWKCNWSETVQLSETEVVLCVYVHWLTGSSLNR